MIIEFIQLLSQGITIICFIHIFRLNLKLMKICRELMDNTNKIIALKDDEIEELTNKIIRMECKHGRE
jgi:low affinity Fe/Cu permease